MKRPDDAKKRPIRAAVYESATAAENAVRKLRQEGFTETEISVFSPNVEGEQRFSELEPAAETGAPKASAATGGVVGGVIGGLTAIATLATAGGLPVIVAGGMAGLLTGGVVGGLAGAMMNRGLEKESADFFDQAVADGKFLVAIEPEDPSDRRLEIAARILRQTGAQPVSLPEG